MNDYFQKFLKRTKLDGVYESLKGEIDSKDDFLVSLKAEIELVQNSTYQAISDAFECSEEYKEMQQERENRTNALWDEASKSFEYGEAAYDCSVVYRSIFCINYCRSYKYNRYR